MCGTLGSNTFLIYPTLKAQESKYYGLTPRKMKTRIWILLILVSAVILNYSCSNQPKPATKFYGDTTITLLKEYNLNNFKNYSQLLDSLEQHRHLKTTPCIYFLESNMDTVKLVIKISFAYHFGRNNSVILRNEGLYQNGNFEPLDSLGSLMRRNYENHGYNPRLCQAASKFAIAIELDSSQIDTLQPLLSKIIDQYELINPHVPLHISLLKAIKPIKHENLKIEEPIELAWRSFWDREDTNFYWGRGHYKNCYININPVTNEQFCTYLNLTNKSEKGVIGVKSLYFDDKWKVNKAHAEKPVQISNNKLKSDFKMWVDLGLFSGIQRAEQRVFNVADFRDQEAMGVTNPDSNHLYLTYYWHQTERSTGFEF